MALPSPSPESLVIEGRARIAANVRSLMGRGVDPTTSRRRVTQTALGKVLGISQGPMSERLAGNHPFDTDELLLIAHYFQVDITDLMGDVRSRCFAPLTLVNGPDQLELAFDAHRPTLTTV